MSFHRYSAGRGHSLLSAGQFRQGSATIAIVLVLAMVSGCRRSPLATVPVRGTVTYMGKRVPYGVVKFQPAGADQGRPAVASIKPDGTYVVETLKNAGGLVPGEYLVTVFLIKPPGREDNPGDSGAASNASDRFAQNPAKSTFTLVIGARDGSKVFDISLDNK